MNRLCRCRRMLAILGLVLISGTGISGASAQQKQMPRRPDPKVLLLNNYRRYPDRYIRILEESWKYDALGQTASHSFTLRNSAATVFSDIEISFTYLSSEGKVVHSQTVKIPGSLAPYEVRRIKDFKIKKVPAASDQAVLAVAKALIPS
jgi:hypothetical protein